MVHIIKSIDRYERGKMVTVNELFAGIGAFRKALINLGVPHEIVGISEIDKYAIRSYEAMYGKTRNYGDISKVDKLDYADLWTYGFPCQDISIAGNQKGIIKGKTRSGLLWEVQRLLEKSADSGESPKYLIMENVKALVGKKFFKDFKTWTDWLNSIGYNTYFKILKASDYGVPQNRERVFAVSVRKDIDTGFEFPQPTRCTKSFADFLQQDVDDKYFLTDDRIEYFKEHNVVSKKMAGV
jgi:DNA (cytosine-5)-methyltransferase 1